MQNKWSWLRITPPKSLENCERFYVVFWLNVEILPCSLWTVWWWLYYGASDRWRSCSRNKDESLTMAKARNININYVRWRSLSSQEWFAKSLLNYVIGRYRKVTRQRRYDLINIYKLCLCHSRIRKFPLWTCRETVALQSSTVPTIPLYVRVQKWKVDRCLSLAVLNNQRQFCRAFK